MFKLDKKTHLIILFTFAMVFVVVYLYYTIQDLRKAQVELKRLQDELAVVKNLSNTVSCMKTDVDELKTVKHIKANIAAPTTATAPVATTVSVEPIPTQEDVASSVDTEEIRDILDGGMDDEEIVSQEGEVHEVDDVASEVEEEVQQDTPVEEVHEDENIEVNTDVPVKDQITPEELKNMKVDELKELCREYNLSTKGNKNDLLVRIFEHLGMN